MRAIDIEPAATSAQIEDARAAKAASASSKASPAAPKASTSEITSATSTAASTDATGLFAKFVDPLLKLRAAHASHRVGSVAGNRNRLGRALGGNAGYGHSGGHNLVRAGITPGVGTLTLSQSQALKTTPAASGGHRARDLPLDFSRRGLLRSRQQHHFQINLGVAAGSIDERFVGERSKRSQLRAYHVAAVGWDLQCVSAIYIGPRDGFLSCERIDGS